MKKIRRTTITVKKRELFVVKNADVTAPACPICNFPINDSLFPAPKSPAVILSFDSKTAAGLPASGEAEKENL